ncbi:MAG: TrkH family potassium uptake protein [Thermoprotei archaeon]|nr:TrkH family potassium uptake protein [Thermoprotei archaeon]
MNLKAVASGVSALLLVFSLMALVNGIAFLLFSGEAWRWVSVKFTLVSAFLSALSLSLYLVFRKFTATELEEAFIVVSLFWLLAPLFSAILYTVSFNMSPIDGYFESMSGLTGTGLTMISSLESAPPVVLMWRSLTQWIGGLGIVVFGGALLPFIYRVIRSAYIVERGPKLAPTLISSMRRLFTLYLAYTLLGVALLYASGMSFFEAVNHAMTGIATAGMTTRDGSMTYWYESGKHGVLAATVIIMILGATNFTDLYNMSRGRVRAFLSSVEVRGFTAILALLTLAVAIISIASGSPDRFWIRLYNLVSALTTTGFQVGSLKEEPEAYKAILAVAMAIGGATFSTAAGIKIKRIVVAVKGILWELERPLIPRGAVITRRVGDLEVKHEDITAVYAFILIHVIMAVALSIAFKTALDYYNIGGFSYADTLVETLTAVSDIGLSVGLISQDSPTIIKILAIIAMYLGRIEYLPLYMIVSAYYRKKIAL